VTRARDPSTLARKDLRQALRSWHDSVQLGRSPLADLPAAEAARRAGGFSSSDVGRGLALRTALQHALDTLSQIPGLKQERWSALLTGLYVDGRSPEYLMDSLGMARSTYDHEHAAALEALGRCLQAAGEAPAAPAVSPAAPQLTPPLPLHPLLGRDELIAALRRQLLAEAPPSIVLHGLPGCGKTTLAAVLAADPAIRQRFPDGVLWAGLGQQPDLAADLGLWAEVLGVPWAEVVRHTRPEARCQLVRSAIGGRRMLLVLDDVWDLAHVRAMAVAGPACAQLVTTRSLSLATELGGVSPVRVPELPVADGVQLLLHFVPALPQADLPRARGLVESLGGLPLALVLVGRRLRAAAALGSGAQVRQVLEDLADPQKRLRVEASRLASDQQPTLPPEAPLSLFAAIGLSERPFDELTRAGFHALGALPPGPATFDEATALAVSRLPADGLAQLVLAGLLEAVGEGRYRLHPAIHDFCRGQGTAPQAYQRLASYTLDRLTRGQPRPAELERDLPVLRAGLDAALHLGSPEDFADLSLALFGPVEQAGAWALAEPYWTRAEAWAREAFDQERLLALQAARAQAALHLAAFTDAECFAMEGLMLALETDDGRQAARMFQVLGAVAFNRGDPTAAESSYQNGLRQAEADGLEAERCALQANLASVYLVRGDVELAKSLLDQALHLARRLGDVRREASILMNLGVVAAQAGEHDQARRAFEESLELSQQTGSWEQRMFLLVNLGALASDEGEVRVARSRFEEALDLARRIGDRVRTSLLLGNLGATRIQLGEDDVAAEALEEGIELARTIGQPEALSLLLTNAGGLDLRQGRIAQADRRLHEALHLADQAGQPRLQAAARCGLANVLLFQGQAAQAEELFRAGLDLAAHSGLKTTEAEAEFGLARIEFDHGKQASARRRAKRCLKLTGEAHPLARDVQAWLASHPAQAASPRAGGGRKRRGGTSQPKESQ
jgi:tetratricopeptide (TPR) repeat protein